MDRKLKQMVIERDGYVCQYCGITTNPNTSDPTSTIIEHMTKDRSENASCLCVSCRRCNSKKNNLSIYEYLGKIDSAINEAEQLKLIRRNILTLIHKMKEREGSCIL